MSITYNFSVPDITCASCVGIIEHVLSSYKTHTITYHVDVTSKKMAISVAAHQAEDDNFRKDIVELMDGIGFTCINLDTIIEKKKETWWDKLRNVLLSHWFQGALGLSVGITFLILSFMAGGLPLAALIAIGITGTLLTFLLGGHSYYHALIKLIKTRTLTMDALFTISTLTVIAVSIAAFFIPWLPMMFEAGLLIFGFRHLGLAIKESIEHKINLDKTFQHFLPLNVALYTDENTYIKRALALIEPGDELLINPGEIIPVDGISLSDSSIYETIKRGKFFARQVKKGEKLQQGMCLAEGADPIRLQVTANAANSYYAELDKSIAKAHEQKAPIEKAATRILQYFIPIVIFLSITSGIVIGLFFPPALAIQCAVAVLVSACPCTLGLIVPLAVKIGIQKGAEHGVQFKSAKALQAADKIDAVVFDVHGTLTTGVALVSPVVVVAEEFDEDDLLYLARILEHKSKHSIGKAIFDKARTQQGTPFSIPEDLILDESNHSGVKGELNNHVLVIGNENMMLAQDVNIAELQNKIMLNVGDSVVYIARDKQLLGYFVVSEPLRKDARHTIDALKKLGKEIHICSGAGKSTVDNMARFLGIPLQNAVGDREGIPGHEHKNAKTTYIKELKARGLFVAMVGDAGNDAPAIAVSDFGIAVKSDESSEITAKPQDGREITEQEAGAVIQSGSLLPIVNAFAIARQTVNNIKQNLIFSFTSNTVAMLLMGGLLTATIGFTLSPGFGALFMVLFATAVLVNAYYFKKRPLQHLQDLAVEEKESVTDSYQQCQQIIKSDRLKLSSEPEVTCEPEVSCEPEVTCEQTDSVSISRNSQSLPLLNRALDCRDTLFSKKARYAESFLAGEFNLTSSP